MKKIALALLIFCSACTNTAKAPERTLRISFNTHPVTVDPRKSGDFVSSTLICLIYEGLTRCLPDGTVENALADKIELSPDGLTYTFTLRPAFWTDQHPITAYDFETSWKKLIDPSFPSLCAYLFYPIKNAEEASKGLVSLDEVGIVAKDEWTLAVTLHHPSPYFLTLTAFPVFLPVPYHLQNEIPDWDQQSASELVCSGPFKIQKMVPNAEILLVKNQQFWAPEKINLDAIHISIVGDETTALQMFERNELDWMGGAISPLPPDASEILKKKDALHYFPMAAMTFCSFNTLKFPFGNAHLRKAFALAINRCEIVEKITQTGQQPATRCIPPSLIGNRQKTIYQPTDPELARLHFRKALQELRIDPEKLELLTLYYKEGQLDKQMAQTLQRQWKDILGITVQLRQEDFKTHKDRLHKRDFQLSLDFLIAQFCDPMNILERFKDPKNPKNYPSWENDSYNHILDQIAITSDPLERFQLFEKAENLLTDEMPIAPIYHWSCPNLCQSRLQNLDTTPNGGVLFERCTVSN